MNDMNEIMRPKEAADYVGSTVGSLATYRYLDKGPTYIKAGRKILYRRADLDAWLEAHTVTPAASA